MGFFAYLDAGSGSLIIQAILGGLAGLGIMFKTLRQRFNGRRHIAEQPTEGSETPNSGS